MPPRYLYVMTTDQADARQILATALVTAIDHVGIAVADLDVAIAWYHEHLGMILVHEEVNEDQGIREAMLAVRGAPIGTAQIQLMAPINDSSTIAKFLDKRGPGIQQLAVRVSDLDSLSERLRLHGVRLVYEDDLDVLDVCVHRHEIFGDVGIDDATVPMINQRLLAQRHADTPDHAAHDLAA